MTWLLLVARVSDLCGRRKEIRVLVIRIPCRYKSGVQRIGLSCVMMDILHQFGCGELPGWLDILEGHRAETDHTWPDRRLLTSGRWDPLHHEFGRQRLKSDNMTSLTLSGVGVTNQDVLHSQVSGSKLINIGSCF